MWACEVKIAALTLYRGPQQSRARFSDLPDDVVRRILDYAEEGEHLDKLKFSEISTQLARASRIPTDRKTNYCARPLQVTALVAKIRSMKHVDFSGCFRDSKAFVEFTRALSQTVSLSHVQSFRFKFDFPEVDGLIGPFISFVQKMTELTTLDLSFTTQLKQEFSLSFLTSLKKIDTLGIHGRFLTNPTSFSQSLKSMTSLKTLSVSYSKIGYYITIPPQLEILMLHAIKERTGAVQAEAFAESIKKASLIKLHLTHSDIFHYHRVMIWALARRIGNLEQLQELSIEGNKDYFDDEVSGMFFREVSKLTNLRTLNLGFVYCQQHKYVALLQNLTGLTDLNICANYIDDDVVKYLKSLPLKRLIVGYCTPVQTFAVPDKLEVLGLEYIESYRWPMIINSLPTTLKNLHFSSPACMRTHEQLLANRLSLLTNLQTLELVHMEIGYNGQGRMIFECLKRLTHLRNLSLWTNRVGADPLVLQTFTESIKNLEWLVELNLNNNLFNKHTDIIAFKALIAVLNKLRKFTTLFFFANDLLADLKTTKNLKFSVVTYS